MSAFYEGCQEIAAASSQNTERLVAVLDRIAVEQGRLADALAVQAKATLACFDAIGIAVQQLADRTAPARRVVTLHDQNGVEMVIDAARIVGWQPISHPGYSRLLSLLLGDTVPQVGDGGPEMVTESPAEVAAALRGDTP